MFLRKLSFSLLISISSMAYLSSIAAAEECKFTEDRYSSLLQSDFAIKAEEQGFRIDLLKPDSNFFYSGPNISLRYGATIELLRDIRTKNRALPLRLQFDGQSIAGQGKTWTINFVPLAVSFVFIPDNADDRVALKLLKSVSRASLHFGVKNDKLDYSNALNSPERVMLQNQVIAKMDRLVDALDKENAILVNNVISKLIAIDGVKSSDDEFAVKLDTVFSDSIYELIGDSNHIVSAKSWYEDYLLTYGLKQIKSVVNVLKPKDIRAVQYYLRFGIFPADGDPRSLLNNPDIRLAMMDKWEDSFDEKFVYVEEDFLEKEFRNPSSVNGAKPPEEYSGRFVSFKDGRKEIKNLKKNGVVWTKNWIPADAMGLISSAIMKHIDFIRGSREGVEFSFVVQYGFDRPIKTTEVQNAFKSGALIFNLMDMIYTDSNGKPKIRSYDRAETQEEKSGRIYLRDDGSLMTINVDFVEDKMTVAEQAEYLAANSVKPENPLLAYFIASISPTPDLNDLKKRYDNTRSALFVMSNRGIHYCPKNCEKLETIMPLEKFLKSTEAK